MPVTNPSVLERNFTPSSTELVSPSVPAGVAVEGQIVQGQSETTAVVLNVQDTGSIWLPVASRAPLRLTVYVVLAARLVPGSSVTVRLAPTYVVVAGTRVFPGPRIS